MAALVAGIFKALFQCFKSSSEEPQHTQQQHYPGGGPQHQQQQSHPNKPPHGQQHQQQQPNAWSQQQPQPHYPPKPHSPPHTNGHAPSHQPSQPHHYPNTDQPHHDDPHYTSLRDAARKEGDAMGRCFSESKQAYEGGDGGRAKELSNEGKRHQVEMARLNGEASDWIFGANNKNSPADTVDLHGLFVREAVEQSDKAIQRAQAQGADHVRLIVGKGLHSPEHVAKIKPAIEDLMRKHQLVAHLDEHNAGVLIVDLGRAGNGSQGMDAGEITRRLERDGDSCIIM